MSSFIVRIQFALALSTLPLAIATGWSIVLAFRHVWLRARTIARATFGLSVLVLFLAWFAIPMFILQHAVVAEAGMETSDRARFWAETISEGMNCTVLVFLSTPIALGIWVFSAWKARKAQSPLRLGTAEPPS